jgi:hypothetical protein
LLCAASAARPVTNPRDHDPAGNRRHRARLGPEQSDARIIMTNKEREAREAHIRKIEADTRAERDKTRERSGVDREVEQELQTVRPGSDAPSRAGITPDGSGADGERG